MQRVDYKSQLFSKMAFILQMNFFFSSYEKDRFFFLANTIPRVQLLHGGCVFPEDLQIPS